MDGRLKLFCKRAQERVSKWTIAEIEEVDPTMYDGSTPGPAVGKCLQLAATEAYCILHLASR
jgi:hypothetical protein